MFNFAVVGLGPWEIALIVLVVLLLFGARRLPEVGRSLGQGMREFKNSVTGKDTEDGEQREIERSKADAASEDPARTGETAPTSPAGTAGGGDGRT